jgi:hypothetical protein
MKKLLTIIICSFLICTAFVLKAQNSGKYQNDLVAEKFKGKVKSYTTFTYSTVKTNSTIDSDWRFKTTVTYNSQGNVTAMSSRAGASRRPRTDTLFYSYDKDGRQITIKQSAGHIISSSVYSRNKENNLVENQSMGNARSVIVYNKAGRRDTMYNYINNRLDSKVIYHYNKRNDMVEEIRYNYVQGNSESRAIYAYDKHGNKISQIRYDGADIIKNRVNYEYDERGDITAQTDSIHIESFGAPNDHTRDVHTNTYKYIYFDKQGNWIQRDMLTNNKAVQSVKREIEYY